MPATGLPVVPSTTRPAIAGAGSSRKVASRTAPADERGTRRDGVPACLRTACTAPPGNPVISNRPSPSLSARASRPGLGSPPSDRSQYTEAPATGRPVWSVTWPRIEWPLASVITRFAVLLPGIDGLTRDDVAEPRHDEVDWLTGQVLHGESPIGRGDAEPGPAAPRILGQMHHGPRDRCAIDADHPHARP